MIIPLPFIVSLLFTITYATDFEYKIDLNRCGADGRDMVCFVRKNCIDSVDASKGSMERFTIPTDGIPEGVEKCDVIVQTKQFNKRIFMLLMQVKGNLKPENGIKIFQNAEKNVPDQTLIPVIACSKGKDPEGKLTDLTLEPLGISTFESDIMNCAVTISHASKYIKILLMLEDNPVIKFTTIANDGTEKPDELKWISEDALWKTSDQYCDPSYIGNAVSSEYLLTEIHDKTRELLKCPEDAKLLVSYTKDDKDVTIETNEVKCEGASASAKYTWSSPEAGEVAENTKFSIGCIKSKYCTGCPEPTAFSQDECPTCKPLIEEDTNGCKVRKCPEDKFTIDGRKELISEKGITCEKKSEGQSEWKIHYTDAPQSVAKASCFIFKGCDPFPRLNCPNGVECKTAPVLNTEIFNYTCPDADAVLQQNKKPVTPSCNKDTHEWSEIDPKVDLYCAVDETKTDANKGGDPNTGGGGLPIALAVVGGLVAAAAVGGILFYMLVYKKKQEAKKTTKKEEGTSKKSSKKVESKSGGVGSSNEAKKEEKKSDPNKESEKPPADAAKEPAKDGKEAPKDGAEPPKDAAATPAAGAATPAAPATPGAAAPPTPAADSAPAPADATPV